MIGNFTFNGIASQSLGLVAKSISRPILPSIRPRTVQINGVSGLYDFGRVAHDVRYIVMQIGWITKTDYYDYREKTHDIAAWLDTATWSDLIINDETDKAYKARVVGGVPLEQLFKLGIATVTFECQPYSYALFSSGDDVAWAGAETPWISSMTFLTAASYKKDFTTNGTLVFTNPGNQAINFRSPQQSKFDIKIDGTFSTLTLALNGKTINYTEALATGTLIFDSINLEVYVGSTNKLGVITGDYATFFECVAGENTLTVSGTNLNISVTIDLLPMWL